MKKRKFTAEFKSQIVLEVLAGERELGVIAAEHQINPSQLRAWKTAFLEKAPSLFTESKSEKEAQRREKALQEEKLAMLKTIGELTMERDFLMAEAKKKNYQVFLRRP